MKSYDQETKLATIEVRNHFTKGTEMEVLSPRMLSETFVVNELYDETGELLEVANKPMQVLQMKVDLPLQEHDMIRKTKVANES